VADEAVADAIGAAIPLVKLNGEIPADVMVKLNEGPANHIRDAAYKYVRRLDKVNFVPRHNFLLRYFLLRVLGTAGGTGGGGAGGHLLCLFARCLFAIRTTREMPPFPLAPFFSPSIAAS